MNVDGAVIALHSGNSDQVSAAVEELLKRKRVEPEQSQPAPVPAPEPAPFHALLNRFRAVAHQLQSFEGSLDAAHRLALAEVVAEVRTAAAGLGAVVWDRR